MRHSNILTKREFEHFSEIEHINLKTEVCKSGNREIENMEIGNSEVCKLENLMFVLEISGTSIVIKLCGGREREMLKIG